MQLRRLAPGNIRLEAREHPYRQFVSPQGFKRAHLRLQLNDMVSEEKSMTLSTQPRELYRAARSDRIPLAEGKGLGCELAQLLNQSIALYLTVEKVYWHLRLNSEAQLSWLNVDVDDSVELAGDASSDLLRLISRITHLQQILEPDLDAECKALLTVIAEKCAEHCALPNPRINDFGFGMAPALYLSQTNPDTLH